MNQLLFHAGKAGVADEVFLEVGVERALAAQPGEGAFGLLGELNLREVAPRFIWRRTFDPNLDQISAECAEGGGLGVHATCSDELGLGERVGRENFDEGEKVFVRELVEFAAEQSADVALGDAATTGDVALSKAATLGLALEGDAEVAHGEVESAELRVESETARELRA